MKSILFCVMVWSAGGAVVAAANPVITSINGYSDGFAVVNGRYIGQLIAVPPGGTNRYKNYLAIDSFNYGSLAANPYYWDLQGANFGAAAGTVGLGVAPSPFTSISIVSWTPTTIRIKVVATPAFLSSAIAVTVKTATGAMTAPFNGNVVGTIKGRAAGQCTWFAAETRLQHGLSIPPTPMGQQWVHPRRRDTGHRLSAATVGLHDLCRPHCDHHQRAGPDYGSRWLAQMDVHIVRVQCRMERKPFHQHARVCAQ